MNIYEKIQTVKEQFLELNVKKSGVNKFAGFTYYELADIVPELIKLCNGVKLFTKISFTNEEATLVIVNIEKPEEKETYTSPMKELQLKGCNEIQALGGTETYQRRYLYMSAFDITENDMFDSLSPEQNKPETNNKIKPNQLKYIETNATAEQIEKIKIKFKKDSIKDLTMQEASTTIQNLKAINGEAV